MANIKKCKSPECDRDAFAKGFCFAHYRRQLRGGDPTAPIRTHGLVPLPGPIRVEQHVAKALESLAAVRDISQYEVVRSILNDWYKKEYNK